MQWIPEFCIKTEVNAAHYNLLFSHSKLKGYEYPNYIKAERFVVTSEAPERLIFEYLCNTT